ncbi:hypothetical protein Tco_1372653, partial [Tanacetum coccineum]
MSIKRHEEQIQGIQGYLEEIPPERFEQIENGIEGLGTNGYVYSTLINDLFTYEVEIARIANVPCDLNRDDDSKQQMSQESDDDMEYDPSDVEFTA